MNHKLDPIGHKTRHEEYASLHPTSKRLVNVNR
ncbi:hypothetical protein F441_13162 [Phytophthora nicotianae CJ01A1]|uniref:Uncharacterized protein n=4 Tax=Phytophthora nicotianae TaxID=4792 RepID=V9EQP6_PHYNI|nr:hypothetical protein F443_13212 [Phytophthora nicotianae P1569]ETL35024.1 hypothetical protein L916_12805 [Phytophthora nicotianae]ETP11311.1 hypothetical protein F441_13162 [Phytophthora nicotianae CJ01A1]ETP39458.1 hypothetical protein F442_13078 [Phytophthora nicotianae P10297]ETL88257.1 hypothetical protein L917_12649 [Phytophthora nicotianae]